MMVSTLGEKIRARRKERKMTLKDLAGDRITPGQISLVESGKSNPSNDLLEYIAQRLNIKMDYLLESEEEQAKKLCEYYLNVAEIAFHLGKQDNTIEAVEQGISISKQYKLQYHTGVFDMIKAEMKFKMNELEEAQQYCITANSIFLKENNIEYSVKSYMLLGHISIEMGYVNTALNYFLHGESMMSENNFINEVLRAELYQNISKCYSKANNNAKALEYAQIALERLHILEDKNSYASMLLEKCITSAKNGNAGEALNYSREAKRFFSQVNETHEIAEIETNLGDIFSKAGNFEKAYLHFDNAARMKNFINDNSLPMTMIKMSEAYNDSGDCAKASEILKNMDKQIQDGQHYYRIKWYEQLFNINYKLGNFNKAEKILLEGIVYLEKLDYKRHLADFYSLLGKLYIEMGNREHALVYISKGIDIYKELGIILNE